MGFTPSSHSSHAETQNAQAAADEATGAQEEAEGVDWGKQMHTYKLKVTEMTMKLKSISKDTCLKWYIYKVSNDLIFNYDNI